MEMLNLRRQTLAELLVMHFLIERRVMFKSVPIVVRLLDMITLVELLDAHTAMHTNIRATYILKTAIIRVM